jgi:hypothetical protein
MSSSEPAARRFLKQFVIALGGFAAFALVLTWVIDPLSVLYRWGGGGLCGEGIKELLPREAKVVAAIARQPSHVLVGTSRVDYGFDRFDAERLLGGRTFNLGFGGAAVTDESRAVREIASRAPIETVWMALEPGAFLRLRRDERPLVLPARLGEPEFAWREGLFSRGALKGAAATVIRPRLCLNPVTDRDGFRTDVSESGLRRGGARLVERLPDVWGSPDDPAGQYSATTAELRSLARWTRGRNVRLVLFLSPMSDSYWRAIERGGLSGSYRRWREEMRTIAREEGAALVEADTGAFLDPIAVRCPPQSTREQCLFYDPVHFRPEVGAAILAAGIGSQQAAKLDAPSRTP